MNTRLGKSFGLAFVVAVGILALMFALGTFNAQQVGAAAHGDVGLTLDSTAPGAEVEVVVEVKIPNLEPKAKIDIELTGLDVSGGKSPEVTVAGGMTWSTGNGNSKSVTLMSEPGANGNPKVTSVSTKSDTGTIGKITITLPTDTDESTTAKEGLAAGMITITIEPSEAVRTRVVAQDVTATVTVDAGADGDGIPKSLGTSNTVPTGVVLTVDPKSAGAVSYITVEVGNGEGGESQADVDKSAGKIVVGSRIIIDMDRFGVPSPIDEETVSIRGLDNNGFQFQIGTPDNVSVSGNVVTLVVPDMDIDDATPDDLSPHYRVVFSKGAGVTIPSTAGRYAVEAKVGDNYIASDSIEVVESLTLSVEKGARGTTVTVTGKGFTNAINAIFVDADQNGVLDNDEVSLATDPDVDNGTFSHTFEVGAGFKAGTDNYVNAVDVADAAYRDAPIDEGWPTFEVIGSISLSAETAKAGQKITITAADFITDSVTEVKIGGTVVPPSTTALTAGGGKFDVTVTPGVAAGSKKVSVEVGEQTATASLVIEGLPLTVSPSSAVPGQEITIRGSGFSGGAHLATVEVGGEDQEKQANGQDVTDLIVNNSGSFVMSIKIPKTVTATGSSVLVEVVESSEGSGNGREGITKMTIPKPALTLSPAESRTGTTVVANGSGFAASENVSISYTVGDAEPIPRTSVNSDSMGDWTKAFTVPVSADVGSTNAVTATGTSDKTASQEHKTPGASIAVSPDNGRPGITLTITGIDFQAYSAVTKVSIAGLTIPSTGVNTDEDGNFTMTGLLPALAAGTHSLVIEVGSGESANRDSVVFTVGEAGPATLPSAEAFADLTTAGNLIVVWYFDNTSKDWFFYDPRPAVAGAVDLKTVSTGDNVWIQITADQMFQGEMLTAGWNLVTLD